MTVIAQVQAAASDPKALRAAVTEAHVVPLLMSLVQLTGRTEYLEQARPFISGAWDYMQSIPGDLQATIRADLVQAIVDTAATGRHIPEEPPQELFQRMVDVAAGLPVPDIYLPVFLEEAAFGGRDLRKVDWRTPPPPERLDRVNAVVIGAGLSGVAMSVRLQQAGIPHVLIEKNAEAGGTWLENIYPGCGVDTPCHFYSYAFEVNPGWTEYFAKRSELHAYILKCVEKYGVRQRIRFSEEVLQADWDEAASLWLVRTRSADGSEAHLRCNVLISAVGALNRPAIPRIPGLEDFAGPCFHTAQWREDVDLAGKRVAMIGTGASGMQTGPSIAPAVDKLTIFQRSPHWAIHHPLYHAAVSPGVRWAMQHVPFYANWLRLQQFWAGVRPVPPDTADGSRVDGPGALAQCRQ
ncbi:MAG: NAD(P)/FAD-dependent oxidoreductase [Sphingomonadales bacterium]|nr:NAD(P)/FAD-dependent oxidoreductase [Sphingomonadales bacterium]